MSKILAQYKSSSNPNTMYSVTEGDDGVIYCNCKGWRLHSNRRCKHLDMYEATLADMDAMKTVGYDPATPKRSTVESVTDAMILKLRESGYGR